jgi:5-methyltetrahydrofolate--homocysteine methyltransferase
MSGKLYEGKQDEVAALVQKAIDDGIAPSQILSEGLLKGMDKVGQDFKSGELYVPEVLVAARAMHAGMALLRPFLAEGEATGSGKVIIGTVKGDMHDIGKNLVKMMLEGAGFEVIDLGTDVAPEQFAQAAREHQPNIIGMSALLTTTMPQMRATLEALEDVGMRESVKVLIGGAPVTASYADEIGADDFAPDAGSAVDVARASVGIKA